jgi:hypothetical protein
VNQGTAAPSACGCRWAPRTFDQIVSAPAAFTAGRHAAGFLADALRWDPSNPTASGAVATHGGPRAVVGRRLLEWAIPNQTAHDIVLLVTELVTNAVLHGEPPIQLRLRRTSAHVVVEVDDSATFLPRRLRATPEDEHGRGLQLVSLLAHRWGTRPTVNGKSVWCVVQVSLQ